MPLVKTQECLDSDLLLLTSLPFQMKVEGWAETGMSGHLAIIQSPLLDPDNCFRGGRTKFNKKKDLSFCSSFFALGGLFHQILLCILPSNW